MKISEFARRRKQLMRMMGHDSVAILPTALEKIRNRDAEYPFRPDSDFYYLTGFPEPEAVLVLVPGRKHGETILFVLIAAGALIALFALATGRITV